MADDTSGFSLFNPSGMFTPDQAAQVRSRALMSMGAALMKASGPSPYKNTWFSGLGSGVEGLLGGIQNGTDDMLKQQLTRGQIAGQQLSFAQQIGMLKMLGLPIPPALQQYAGSMGGAPGGAPGAMTQPALSAPAAPGGGGGTPTMIPTAGAPGVTGVPWTGGGAAPPATTGAAPGTPAASAAPAATPTGAAPAAAGAPSLADPRILGAARVAYALGGPKAAADVAGNAMAKNLEDTPDIKNSRAAGFSNPRDYQAALDQDKLDNKRYDSLFGGLQAMGNASAARMDDIKLSDAIVHDPGFYSGTGAPFVQGLRRAMAAFSPGDKNADAATMQEAYHKVLSGNILAQADDMKAQAQEMGPGSMRLFQQQIQLMKEAAGTDDNSPQGLRFLSEVQKRTAQRNVSVADMAADYKAQHGKLDSGFEKTLRKYFADNPLFSREELANPTSIAHASDRKPAAPAPAPAAAAAAAATPSVPGSAPTPFVGRTATGPGGKKMREVAPNQWVPM